jgi:acyl-CoA synthetase (AMP-forming)/AMP-acid ligase II/enoyl-CoA hydratase/carnithine racemase
MAQLSTSPPVLVDIPSPYITRVTLNRPAALNALNVSLVNALVSALRSAAGRSNIIILQGSGERAFCAGEDLKESLAPRTHSPEELRTSLNLLQDITRLTAGAKAVIISAVQGYAVGGGAEIALGADFVIAGPTAQFWFPEVAIGHAVTGGISQRLTHLVGLLKAKELLLTGRRVGAQEALKIGMVCEVTGDPKARALELALELNKKPAAALSYSKQSLERAMFPNMDGILQQEVEDATYCMGLPMAQSIFKAFKAEPSSDGVEVIRDLNTALVRAAEKTPDKTFLKFGTQNVTFLEFAERVKRSAGLLRAQCDGCNTAFEEKRIMAMMRNSIEMIELWFASMYLGAVWVPINPELRSKTLRNIILKCEEVLFFIVDEEVSQYFSESKVLKEILPHGRVGQGRFIVWPLQEPAWTDIQAEEYLLSQPVRARPSQLAALFFTSGTTGTSKACKLSHQYHILSARSLIECFGLKAEDVLYCPFPLFHMDATVLTLIPALLLGATAAISTRFSVSKFWDEIRFFEATVYDFMGACLIMLFKAPPKANDRDHKVRLAWGVPVPAQWAAVYEERFGHPLFELYGSTESGIPIVQQDVRVPGSCGKALPGYTIRIADEDGDPVPPNTAGQLLLRADQPNAFFKGYLNDAEATSAAFADAWLNTGDIARINEEGDVFFVGRKADVIRRRGENISCLEVELEYLQHPEVAEVAAYAIPNITGPGWEDDLKVSFVRVPGSSLHEKSLFDWAVQTLSRFHVADVLTRVDEIPKTPTGKADRTRLTSGERNSFESHGRLNVRENR